MLGQVGPKLAPSWPQVGACWPKLAQVGQVGPKWASKWPQVGPCWLMLAPSWPHDGPSSKVSPRLTKASTKALPLRLSFSKMSAKALPQALRHYPSSKGSPRLAKTSTKALPLRPGFSKLSTKALPQACRCGPSSKVSPRLAKASTKALPSRPGFFKMSTKALPQAFRRLIVRSGCSILLLSILKVVSFWCFFQLVLSWQVFQNDLFKRSSQVVLVGSSS